MSSNIQLYINLLFYVLPIISITWLFNWWSKDLLNLKTTKLSLKVIFSSWLGVWFSIVLLGILWITYRLDGVYRVTDSLAIQGPMYDYLRLWSFHDLVIWDISNVLHFYIIFLGDLVMSFQLFHWMAYDFIYNEILPDIGALLSHLEFSYILSGFNRPANETMFSLITVYTETLGVCLLVLFVVSILLAYILDHFVVREFWFTEEKVSPQVWNTWDESIFDSKYMLDGTISEEDSSLKRILYGSPSVFRNPKSFTKESESLLDVFFLLIPTLIIVYLLVHTVGFVYSNDMNNDKLSTSFDLDVIASQWYWSYGYNLEICNSSLLSVMDADSSVFNKVQYDSIILNEEQDHSVRFSGWIDYSFERCSKGTSHLLEWSCSNQVSPYVRLHSVDKSLIIPVNVYINSFITSEDVLHSWSMPQLGIKVDAIPGRISNFLLYSNYTGKFFGQCSELCGVLHGFMPIELVVLDRSSFFLWTSIWRDVEPGELLGLSEESNSKSIFTLVKIYEQK